LLPERLLQFAVSGTEALPRYLVEADHAWLRITLQSGDPIFFGADLPGRYDSALEERFAREFREKAPDWDLIREPEPLRAGEHLIFPDFAIFHRRDPTRRALLEIVGFWTPRYLQAKLERLRAAGAPDLILCVDDSLNCTNDAWAELRHVVRFKRRIDVREVLERIEAMLDSRGPLCARSRAQCSQALLDAPLLRPALDVGPVDAGQARACSGAEPQRSRPFVERGGIVVALAAAFRSASGEVELAAAPQPLVERKCTMAPLRLCVRLGLVARHSRHGGAVLLRYAHDARRQQSWHRRFRARRAQGSGRRLISDSSRLASSLGITIQSTR
jgi:hypothetical protein